MPLALPPGVKFEFSLPPNSHLPSLEPWEHDVADLITASLAHPELWPEARGQHLQLINRRLERDWTRRQPSRQVRRQQQRKKKRDKR